MSEICRMAICWWGVVIEEGNDLQVYQLWTHCEQFRIISSCGCCMACMKCSSEGKEAFDFNESEVSVRFYTSMLAGKVSKSADSYTLQVQRLSKMRRNPKFQCRAHFRCFDSLQFAVLWSFPFLPFLCTFLAILCHLHFSFKLILCIGCILVPTFLWIILYMSVDVPENDLWFSTVSHFVHDAFDSDLGWHQFVEMLI